MLFEDRFDAGRVMASKLGEFSGRNDVVVLALPRGGVPVGYEVAQALRAPFDVFVVRKLGTPGQEELAMGALASGGVTVLNREVIQALGIPRQTINAVVAREERELERREREYRGQRPAASVRGRTAIVVDDGLARKRLLKLLLQFRSLRLRPVQHSSWRSTKWFALLLRSRSRQSGSGIGISLRPQTKKYATSWRALRLHPFCGQRKQTYMRFRHGFRSTSAPGST